MKTIITKSDKQTKDLAKKIAKEAKFNIIALMGELGAGKTTFVQGFAKGLGIKDKIISPTFVLIRQHSIPHTPKTLFHIDLYRMEDDIDIKQLGLEEIWSNPDHIVIIEWAEKLETLPQNTINIKIEKLTEHIRKLEIRNFLPF